MTAVCRAAWPRPALGRCAARLRAGPAPLPLGALLQGRDPPRRPARRPGRRRRRLSSIRSGPIEGLTLGPIVGVGHAGDHGKPEADRLPERQPPLRGDRAAPPRRTCASPNLVELKNLQARIVTDDAGRRRPGSRREAAFSTRRRSRCELRDDVRAADGHRPGRRSSAPPSSTSRPARWSRTSPSPCRSATARSRPTASR